MTGDLSVPAPQPNPSGGLDGRISGFDGLASKTDMLIEVRVPRTSDWQSWHIGDAAQLRRPAAVPVVPSARVDLDLEAIEVAYQHVRQVVHTEANCGTCGTAIHAIPALVAEVRRLREDRERWVEKWDAAWADAQQLRGERDAARAEAERLRGDRDRRIIEKREMQAEVGPVREALQAVRYDEGRRDLRDC